MSKKSNKYNLVYYPSDILRTTCKTVVDLDVLHKNGVFKSMEKLLKKHDGVGLAGPQVGIDQQVVLIAPRADNHFFLINPKIIFKSDRKILDQEGCLSLPQIYGNVIRHESVVVQALNPEGKEIEIEAHDFTARIIQHELDHLHGILFTDLLTQFVDGEKKFKQLQKEATPEQI